MSNNGAAGIRISGAGSQGLNAGVTRNSIHRNGGGGVAVFGPNFVLATVSENTVNHNLGNGVSADDSFTHVSVSANSLTLNSVVDLSQSNAASWVVRTPTSANSTWTAAQSPRRSVTDLKVAGTARRELPRAHRRNVNQIALSKVLLRAITVNHSVPTAIASLIALALWWHLRGSRTSRSRREGAK